MEDEGRNFRKGKPQQRLYRPGSGPLRKSSPGLDNMMENCRVDNNVQDAPRGRGQGRFKAKGYSAERFYNEDTTNRIETGHSEEMNPSRRRFRKPEQPLYTPKPVPSVPANFDAMKISSDMPDDLSSPGYSHQNVEPQGVSLSNKTVYSKGYTNRRRGTAGDTQVTEDYSHNENSLGRNSRQNFEGRAFSPVFSSNYDSTYSNRGRDTRSMESSARHMLSGHGSKPPSGRRNSAVYPSTEVSKAGKYIPSNLDNMPPRFKKKYLAESGQYSLDGTIDQSRELYPPMHSSMQTMAYNHSHQYPMQDNSVMWSQTLPARGRGRLRDFERDKLMTSYVHNFKPADNNSQLPGIQGPNLQVAVMDGPVEGLGPVGENTATWRRNQVHSNSSSNNSSVLPVDEDANTVHNDIPQTTIIVNSNCLGPQVGNLDADSAVGNDAVNKKDLPQEQEAKDDGKTSPTSLSASNDELKDFDWTEEVEKTLGFEDNTENTTSISSSFLAPNPVEVKPKESSVEPKSGSRSKGRRKDKRSGGSRKRPAANRSSSRGNHQDKVPDQGLPKNQSTASGAKPERTRKDSHHDKHTERERRDSYRSNRSNNENGRDELDKWRSWRSYSRETSQDRRIISRSNSRDPSGNRAILREDARAHQLSQAVNGRNSRTQRRNSGNWAHSRTTSVESWSWGEGPAPQEVPPARSPGRRRNSRRKHSDRKQRDTAETATSTNWRDEMVHAKSGHKERSEDTESSRKRGGNNNVEYETKNGESGGRGGRGGRRNQSSHQEGSGPPPGLLLLPPQSPLTDGSASDTNRNIGNRHQMDGGAVQQKTLFDHQNPFKPIVVQATQSPARIVDMRNDKARNTINAPDSMTPGRPSYYDSMSEAHRSAKNRKLLLDIEHADSILHKYCAGGASAIMNNWQDILETRKFLQHSLQVLLTTDIKFCQSENVEQNFWKILYHNFIEVLKKGITQDNREQIISTINFIIEDGNKYFDGLVELLETTYKFKVDEFLNSNHLSPPKGLAFVGLALISVQKLYLFLGDLSRYKEQVNETNNYGKSKYWYTKAQQINPKNGRPYNQLAILAIYARRKLDAVYYYMRSLMSSNPFYSARESLKTLFDDNRKKYESAERKRRSERAGTATAAAAGSVGTAEARSLRREVWVSPEGGRTTTLVADQLSDELSDDDQLQSMSTVELNKSFIISYLHVHGKLITKVGMETFYSSASLMVRQFRALLRHQPLPTNANRLLQLTALNMFAIDSTTPVSQEGAVTRSEWTECALSVALLMFGALLERACDVLAAPAAAPAPHEDAVILLPAIKVWCDWMLCHSETWNPPPSCDRFKIGEDTDPWDWLARFMNILEPLAEKSIPLESSPKEGLEAVVLPEDSTMAGFTPLMYNRPASAYAARAADAESARHALRVRRLLFFGTEYLCGVDPPALRPHYGPDGAACYVSAVRVVPAPVVDTLQEVSEDEEEEEAEDPAGGVGEAAVASGEAARPDGDEATLCLLRRRGLLEQRRRTMERRRERTQELLRRGQVRVEIEVRPRYLVPDTNCFIDHLDLLQPPASFTLAVPLVVVSELEGLSRAESRVGASARAALAWLSERPARVRFATTRGSMLASGAFTDEPEPRDADRRTNDDRVLATALSIARNQSTAQPDDVTEEECSVRRLVREVVLLTEDRNLRVKALAADLPARSLAAFLRWAANQ